MHIQACGNQAQNQFFSVKDKNPYPGNFKEVIKYFNSNILHKGDYRHIGRAVKEERAKGWIRRAT